MAQEESDKDKKTSTARRRGIEAGSRGRGGRDGPQQVPPPSAYEPPKDLSALRAARLKSMTTPPTARSRMKVEYVQQRPTRTRSASVADSKSPRRSNSIFARGLVSQGSKSPKARVKDKSQREVKSDDEAQYVYKSRSGVDRRDFQKEHDKAARELRRRNKTTEKDVKPNRQEVPRAERRKTEPTTKSTSTDAVKRPVLRKSTTTVSNIHRPDSHRPAVARSETSNAKSTVSTNKKSSLLGSWFAAPPPIPEKMVSCLTCAADDVPVSKSAKLPCTHRMCHSCLKRIFKMSVSDPAHMPPRCCTEEHIDLKHVDKLFNQDFKKQWNHKFKEYTAKNRVYCPKRDCGEWIQAKHMYRDQGRKIGKCPKCKTLVCGICNQKAHKSRDCPKDPATIELTKVAKEKGWQKCYNCSRMVELKEGCNHMTCWCRAEFCMVCGLKWKSCDCPWFNYDAVGDLQGNPVRYQQELDRRRDQEAQDEEYARRLAGFGRRTQARQNLRPDPAQIELGNAAGHHMNQNFVQQAREVLTANYQNAEAAARGLLNGWFTGRENPLIGGLPGELNQQVQDLERPRHVYRLRNPAINPQL